MATFIMFKSLNIMTQAFKNCVNFAMLCKFSAKSKSFMVTPRQIGDIFEKRACQLLIDNHLSIVANNYAVAGVGEIDIIAKQNTATRQGTLETLICVEVRARRYSQFGQAAHTISRTKQKRLISTMSHFISEHGYDTMDVRFDVIAFDIIDDDYAVTWIQGAFLTDGL